MNKFFNFLIPIFTIPLFIFSFSFSSSAAEVVAPAVFDSIFLDSYLAFKLGHSLSNNQLIYNSDDMTVYRDGVAVSLRDVAPFLSDSELQDLYDSISLINGVSRVSFDDFKYAYVQQKQEDIDKLKVGGIIGATVSNLFIQGIENEWMKVYQFLDDTGAKVRDNIIVYKNGIKSLFASLGDTFTDNSSFAVGSNELTSSLLYNPSSLTYKEYSNGSYLRLRTDFRFYSDSFDVSNVKLVHIVSTSRDAIYAIFLSDPINISYDNLYVNKDGTLSRSIRLDLNVNYDQLGYYYARLFDLHYTSSGAFVTLPSTTWNEFDSVFSNTFNLPLIETFPSQLGVDIFADGDVIIDTVPATVVNPELTDTVPVVDSVTGTVALPFPITDEEALTLPITLPKDIAGVLSKVLEDEDTDTDDPDDPPPPPDFPDDSLTDVTDVISIPALDIFEPIFAIIPDRLHGVALYSVWLMIPTFALAIFLIYVFVNLL